MAKRRPGPVLTVDVEEWFHVCGEPAYTDPGTWENRVKRVHVGVARILEALSGTPSRATFFVLGWVARQSPALVRSLSEAGHEVGCHGDLHRRLFEISPSEFREDLRRSRDTIEQIVGCPVTSYRAPEWSMRTPSNPALAILVEEGFRIDSSLVPAPPVGLATNPEDAFWLKTFSGDILEVPPLTGSFFFRKALLGGGVCSRLSRFSRVLSLIDQALVEDRTPVLYWHPWEFDPEHPAMRLSPLGRLVHFGGRARAMPRLKRLLELYEFKPISEVAVSRVKQTADSLLQGAAA